MTLQRFRRLMARSDVRDVRRSMTLALMVEVPNSADGYTRFYDRVVQELQRSAGRPLAQADPLVHASRPALRQMVAEV